MSAAMFVLGLVLGVMSTRGAAFLGAKARIVDLQDAHDAEMRDLHKLYGYREQAIWRALSLDGADSDARVVDPERERNVFKLPPRRVS